MARYRQRTSTNCLAISKKKGENCCWNPEMVRLWWNIFTTSATDGL